uniref:Peptidase_M14 domain-containing protein n=1 Tax=Rhabditophanes sp. KR3021 TaxID=114890 RepID=A0AC35UHH1_9BILA
MKLLFASILTFFLLANGYELYEGYKVLNVVPLNKQQVIALNDINNQIKSKIDFWKRSTNIGKAAHLMVSPGDIISVEQYLKKHDLEAALVVKDVSTIFNRTYQSLKSYKLYEKHHELDAFDFNTYHTFDSIENYITNVAAQNPTFVSIASLGKSHEGRDTKYLKIGYPAAGAAVKPAVFIDANIHAREWISNSVALCTINALTSNPATYKDLLTKIDIYIAPVANPDGYEYSRTKDRNWRKTRSGPYAGGCYGVDPNRNFPFKWGVAGTSDDPCDETFLGQSPLSEVECANLAHFIDANNNSIKAYATLHSYEESILYPWGYAMNTLPPDVADLKKLGNSMATAIHGVHKTKYVVENSALLYPAAGASDDYSKSKGVKYVYTIELRPGTGDTSNDNWFGFDLPAHFIKPTCEETVPGLFVIFNQVATEFAK